MEKTIQQLQKIVTEYETRLSNLDVTDFASKPNPEKWSKKEVLGHLIDSAHNNLRRFICAQYDDPGLRITYDQNFWVKANRYQEMPEKDLIQLWVLMNERICRVLEIIPVEKYDLLCNTGFDEPNLNTIEWLAKDYVKHLKHHMNQIFKNAFDVVYP
jgi:hypothetical protein